MADAEFDVWREELLATGAIVQDGDSSVPWPERERRFNRYVEMVDAVAGTEGLETACALIQSITARHDYGAYQATQHALGRFPSATFVAALVRELPSLIDRQRDWAGELVCGLANSIGTPFEADISEFKRQLAALASERQEAIRLFLLQEEQDGWLRHRVGVLTK
jgi:hypothetical protein